MAIIFYFRLLVLLHIAQTFSPESIFPLILFFNKEKAKSAILDFRQTFNGNVY